MENINYLNSPCHECQERKPMCWDSCKKYSNFKSENQKIKNNREKYKNSISNIARRAKV